MLPGHLVKTVFVSPSFVFFITSFVISLVTSQGQPDLVAAKLQQDWFPAIKVNWGLWVPAQYINFKFVPPNLRILVSGTIPCEGGGIR